jgi:hypothetical protein
VVLWDNFPSYSSCLVRGKLVLNQQDAYRGNLNDFSVVTKKGPAYSFVAKLVLAILEN